MSAPPTPADERMKVLHMVEAGTISIDDATRLLEAIDRSARLHPTRPQPTPTARPARHIRVQITNVHDGRRYVNLAVPLPFMEMALDVVERVAPGAAHRIRPSLAAAQSGYVGPVLEFITGNDRVSILIDEPER